MDLRLLGGWGDVVDDVRKLERALRLLPDTCACGHGSAHLAGACPCCAGGERTLGGGCTDCDVLLASLRDQIDVLVDDALRFLPFVETSSGVKVLPEDSPHVPDVRRQIAKVSATFDRLETAADEFRIGCGASHLAAVKALAHELALVTDDIDATLRPARRGAAGRRRI